MIEEIATDEFLSSLKDYELLSVFEIFRDEEKQHKINVARHIRIKHPTKNQCTWINWLDIGAWISVNRPQVINKFKKLKIFL
jgi:hypothetical protein